MNPPRLAAGLLLLPLFLSAALAQAPGPLPVLDDKPVPRVDAGGPSAAVTCSGTVINQLYHARSLAVKLLSDDIRDCHTLYGDELNHLRAAGPDQTAQPLSYVLV